MYVVEITLIYRAIFCVQKMLDFSTRVCYYGSSTEDPKFSSEMQLLVANIF